MTRDTSLYHLAEEGLVDIDGVEFYAIPDVDHLPPFLMSIVSDGDRWMFISSNGALTCGRVDKTRALFPYETDDRLHAAAGGVGPATRLRLRRGDVDAEWRPLSPSPPPGVERSLARSVIGDAILFEERHDELDLTFAYRWNSSAGHGFIRTATLVNDSPDTVEVELIDGLLGVLPYGLAPVVYERLSNLSNAYKRSELIEGRLAAYSLEAPVSDSAEPEEVLRATTVWSQGLDDAVVALDAAALDTDDMMAHDPAPLVTGRPGAYLLKGTLQLAPGETATWRIVADVALDQFDVAALRQRLRSRTDVVEELDEAGRATGERLLTIMAGADADQCSGDAVACAHHRANVTYNVMRGGVPLDGYRLDRDHFTRFVARHNRPLAEHHAGWLASLPQELRRDELLRRIAELGDVHLSRITLQYLPFSFSRRHGDPSRPWNNFSVRVQDDDGEPVIRFEGNWRDVFQNWEALCVSFPEYLIGVVALFVNASTADGYNPYRITSDGIDWEVPDPEDPWSNIGYWGDHQLVYLLRLLEATERFFPGRVAGLLNERCFTYAEVPYRISSYADLVDDPKATITFDEVANAHSEQRFADVGADGKLVRGPDGELVLATLLEKLLVATLAKLANFVPGGGIWMNTQRPEWNDANNALVGYGLSVVTLFHLRQFLGYLRTLVDMDGAGSGGDGGGGYVVTAEVASWLDRVVGALRALPTSVPASDMDRHRKAVLDALGQAASDHREVIYGRGFSGAAEVVDRSSIVDLCDVAIAHLDATMAEYRRSDGLVHSYNLVAFSADGTSASVSHLPEMLEGQVAALGTGVLDPAAQVELLDALFASGLYRADQHTFMLASMLQLPSFTDKNVVPADAVTSNPLLAGLLAAGDDSVVGRDVDGLVRFSAELVDEAALGAMLERLSETDTWRDLVELHAADTLQTYEEVFGHQSFRGRSAAMYAFEGIGSIYWHMVSKLLVAVHDAASAAAARGDAEEIVARLVDAYDRVRAGLGFTKTAAEFGAVPTEPYSHTPAHAGAQQPGMTGAVKEEILVRQRELGVRYEGGEVVFDPLLLRGDEMATMPQRWVVTTDDGEHRTIEVGAGALGLTICQVPVVVSLTHEEPAIEVEFVEAPPIRRSGLRLGPEVSSMLFGRTGEVRTIRATLPAPRS